MNKDSNVVLIGMPGVGKSTVGVLAAKALTMDFVDTDLLLQRKAGRPLQRMVDELGAEGFAHVEEACVCGLEARGASDVAERVASALALVGLDPARFAGRMWHQLSGGEVKRVALAARLALRPRALLLDEPTANLDRDSAELVRRAVTTARERHGTTLVISGHDHEWLKAICDDMLGIRDGRLAAPAREIGHADWPQPAA